MPDIGLFLLVTQHAKHGSRHTGRVRVSFPPQQNWSRVRITSHNGRVPSRVEHEVLTVDGRDVAISNPRKVLFPQAGYTKLDVAQYYIAVRQGALRAAGDRPNVLVRYPNGIDGEFFYQKRAPESRPDWIDVVALKFPSGRTAEEVVPRDAAALVW